MNTIRPYRPADRDTLYAICIHTGDAGQDATTLYRDPRILPDIFTGPYLLLEPELAFVLPGTEDRPAGYIVGTADTPHFVAAYRDYPAHLHIALAPQARGRGAGRALMDTYLNALRSAGIPRVHLSMNAANSRARAFYDRLGFHQIAHPTPARVLLGRRTHPLPP
jgi:ribosomal protein S18 acetylase RimI-like enzyme